MSKALIDLKETMRRSGLSKTVIYERMAAGAFPRSCKIGVSARWVDEEVDAWVEAQIAARDAFTEAWLSAKDARASRAPPGSRKRIEP
ncbi:MAG: helix-turn-helix transcriptional regulator [Dyella sp.]|uniref:helix-turn-helix transcriptional regulator n=1 Tax=Dyella sp. TaxID=1869338 RepID=UPI003F800456